jgi:hypothetical protein
MAYAAPVAVVGHLLLIVGLLCWGMSVLSDYFTTGRYSRNITHLLGGSGLLLMAIHLTMVEPMVGFFIWLASTAANVVLVAISSLLLLAAHLRGDHLWPPDAPAPPERG